MDTVILTNKALTQKNETIQVVVVKNQTETVSPLSKNAVNFGTDTPSEEMDGSYNNDSKSSVKAGWAQTPVDIRGQGDSKNIFHIQPFQTEKTKIFGTQDVVQRQTSTSLANTKSRIFVPYVAKAVRDHSALEEMKRKVSETFMKNQTFQPKIGDPKSSCVPGTNYEYRTPGAHYKNKNGKIKRPMNAFMVWARDYRGHLASSMLNATNSEISVKLGQLWAGMAPAEKKQYYDIAEKIKVKHRKDYPDWVYQPSAQTLKKKDETHVYTRTPTPPPNLMLARLGQAGSIMNRAVTNTLCDKKPALAQGSSHEGQRNAAMPEQYMGSDIGQDISPRDLASNKLPNKRDFNSAINQKALQDGLYNTSVFSASRNGASSNHIRPLCVARVSYQSALEIPTENTISHTTRGLLATKLSLGKPKGVSGTELSPTIFAKPCYQQRAPLMKMSTISTAGLHQVGPTTVKPTRNFSPGVSALNTSNTQAPQQPRILGIVTSTPQGRLQLQNNVRFHSVRPSLLQELKPNVFISPNQYRPHQIAPGAQQTTQSQIVPDTRQPSFRNLQDTPQRTPVTNQVSTQITQHQAWIEHSHTAHCVPKDIPIVETCISAISAHVRSVTPGSQTGKFLQNAQGKLASPQPGPCNEQNEKSSEAELQTTSLAERNQTRDNYYFSNEIPKASPVSSCKLEDCWKKDTDVGELWPFPFSENPADWDVKDIPSSLYMELFDPYDPFFTADTSLSETFPGSLQLDMERWKRYLDEDGDHGDDKFDQLTSLNGNKTEDFIPSPLPLKQTLCRLLNAHVQISETGDIITGDLVTEADLNVSVGDNEDKFETSELLTTEMAIELSCILKETENSYEEKQQVAEQIIKSILDKIKIVENTEFTVSVTSERSHHKFEVNETGAVEPECLGNKHYEQSDKETSEHAKSDTCKSEAFDSNVKPLLSETDKTGADKSLTSVDSQDDSTEDICSKCVKALSNCEISGDIKNDVVDEKTLVAEANTIKLKTCVTISHNTRSRTRANKSSL